MASEASTEGGGGLSGVGLPVVQWVFVWGRERASSLDRWVFHIQRSALSLPYDSERVEDMIQGDGDLDGEALSFADGGQRSRAGSA